MRDNEIPFNLEPPNIGLMLTRWAKEPRLNYVPNTADMANAIQMEDKHPTCTSCSMQGHTIDDCHIFVNYVLTKKYAKANPTMASKVHANMKLF